MSDERISKQTTDDNPCSCEDIEVELQRYAVECYGEALRVSIDLNRSGE